MTNLSRIFYVNPEEDVSTNLDDVEVVYNQVPENVNFIQQNVQVLVNNGIFVNGLVNINNTSVNIEDDSASDDEGTLEISLNPELNFEVSLFRRFLESAPSVAIQTIIIYMLISTLPYVNKVGEADTNIYKTECSKKNDNHYPSYHENQLGRGTTVINQLVADRHLSPSDVSSGKMIVNANGTVDLVLDNGRIVNLVGYYNSHDGQYVEKATHSICR